MPNQFDDWFERKRCFLCTRDATVTFGHDYFIECSRCGAFHFDRLLTRTMDEGDIGLLPYLSQYTREASDRDETVHLGSENWKEIALAGKNIPFTVKAKKLLELAAARSKPGHSAKFDPHADLALVGAVDKQEFGSLFHDLVHNDYAEATLDWTLTLKGNAWKELQTVGEAPQTVNTQRPGTLYVDAARIEELKSLKHASFDMSKLIRTCEELNICFAEGCYLAVAMLVRSILDHVPPIFGHKNFLEVANNYAGMKSFRDSMKNLENSSRKIADSHLHGQIRKSESLPNETQVNFANDLDVLLAEVVRTLKS